MVSTDELGDKCHPRRCLKLATVYLMLLDVIHINLTNFWKRS